MSFDPRDLSVLAYANGFTHWHYRSPDPLGRLGGDYFAAAAELLRPGDQITVTLLCPGPGVGAEPAEADLAVFAVTATRPAPRLSLLMSSAPNLQARAA